MFVLYLDGVFKGYWCNNPGDIFVEATCRVKGWDYSKVSVKYFSGIDHNDIVKIANIAENGKLEIYEKDINFNGDLEVEYTDEERSNLFEVVQRKVKEVDGTSYRSGGRNSTPC